MVLAQLPDLSGVDKLELRLKIARPYADALRRPDKGNYEVHYRAMSNWFAAIEQWDSDRVYQGSLMVYGWMPGILEGRKDTESCLNPAGANKVAKLLNAGWEEAEKDDLFWKFVNNSFVGTSKFLHFWKPSQFAIWDSHVARALSDVAVKRNKDIESLDVVRCYQALMRKLAGGCSEAMRANEYALFRYGQDVGKSDSKKAKE